MSYKSSFTSGLWLVICDVCGRKYKSSELKLRWDNLMVCEEDYEPRQPQDYVHGVADIQAPPWSRPEQTDDFILFCTPYGLSAIPGYAIPGCMIPGKIFSIGYETGPPVYVPPVLPPPPVHVDGLLQENGSYILLENGSGVLQIG